MKIHAKLALTPFFSVLGGQCILAVDVPGSSPPEEQQGPLLSAPLETQTSHPARRGADQGTISSMNVIHTVCVEPVTTNENNFSDTSYESCTAAPDSNFNLRLTTSCTLVQHMLMVLYLSCVLIRGFPDCKCSSFLLQVIKKDLKKYSKIFEQKDRLSQSKASKV